MKLLSSLAGGLAGAITIALLDSLVRKTDDPYASLDDGKKKSTRLVQSDGQQFPSTRQLKQSTAGRIVFNTLYFGLLGSRMKRALPGGSIAGLGTVMLPRRNANSGMTAKQKWMTLALFIAGGLVSSIVARLLQKRKTNATNGRPTNGSYKSKKNYTAR